MSPPTTSHPLRPTRQTRCATHTPSYAPTDPQSNYLQAHSRKPAGDFTQTSVKQQGLSNDDAKHSSAIHDEPEKSKKGEGVAETAKLKGTVSTDRPGAESEQRGQAKQDKSE